MSNTPTPPKSSARLEQQYRRLLEQFGFTAVDTTLQQLADFLCCSKRHMRTLLLNMEQQQWIRWQSQPGRGHHSTLTLLKDEQHLIIEKAGELLESGNLNGALHLLQEQPHLLLPMLQSKLGISTNDERQTLRVPYYRAMLNLNPTMELRRSERHLVRQIFNGLTRIDEKAGTVEPDLAHHWQQIDPLTWQFFLRRGVLFHDGALLQISDVIASLESLQTHPLFKHIDAIKPGPAHSVVIHLSQADARLPLLLAHTKALIVPSQHLDSPPFNALPIGTGPYRVSSNDELKLSLTAFDHYFGLRGLLDEIELLVWPNLLSHGLQHEPTNATLLSSSTSDQDFLALKPSAPLASEERFVEKGGYFLLWDRESPWASSLTRRDWLREQLNPFQLGAQLDATVRHLWVPASSLLPEWHHAITHTAKGVKTSPIRLPKARTLTIAYHTEHPEFANLQPLIKTALARHQIELQILELSYQDWVTGNAQADVWLGTVNFPVPEPWHVGAWLLETPLLRRSISGGDEGQLETWLTKWREGALSAQTLLEQVLEQGYLQPLFHHWMSLSTPAQIQDVHLNNLGWFDLAKAWYLPNATPDNADQLRINE